MELANSKILKLNIKENVVDDLLNQLPENLSMLRSVGLSNLKRYASEESWLLIKEINSISNGGIFVLSFESKIEDAKYALITIMALLGTAIQVEKNSNSFWYSLGVDPNVNPNAGNGIGENPLHIDMLTFKEFPKGMIIFCERPDPQNGGETLLGSLDSYLKLEYKHSQILKTELFSYWKDENLEQIGNHLDQFAVLPTEEDSKIRFTSKFPAWIDKNRRLYINPIQVEMMLKAISDYELLLKSNLARIKLESGQALVFSQLHYAHGRSALGADQIEIPINLRRQLWRAYFNY